MSTEMRKYSMRRYMVPEYLKTALDFLRPPAEISVSEWCAENRILDAKSSAMPGLWRNSVTPYLVEIMDTFTDYEIEETVFVKPTQVGGTETLNNCFAYAIAQDPGPAMFVYPTDILGASISKNRLEPMIMSSPELDKHYDARNSTDFELQFDNMYATIRQFDVIYRLFSDFFELSLLNTVFSSSGIL